MAGNLVNLELVVNDLPAADSVPELPPDPLTLDIVQKQLEATVAKMVTAPLDQVPRLNIEIQRLRVAKMILQEQSGEGTGVKSDDLYREMSLLSRMIKQTDMDADDPAELQRRRDSEDKLQQAGITAQASRALIDIFSRMNTPDEYPSSPEPDPDDAEGGDPPGAL